ncbi:N-6 DNA methylase [Actinokineospora spheciospongiae]|uniref:N-6 DNA methylase n=1 Tax=Actinokineospora spheciospongiae TaxID=909613 RepID=UPI000D7158A5|nr:N-6 DNA methylase [Actinokineospora spheciospongiae]PWW62809.1 N-6 DNA methylase [Actinokineospora spheciospongiae]
MSAGALVTAAEIARLANVGRAAVGNWRKRHPDFPEPVLNAGGSPVFPLTEVRRWLREQGKLTDDTTTDALWVALDAGHGRPGTLELVADVATHLRVPGSVDLPADVRALLGEDAGQRADEVIESLVERVFQRQQRQHLATPAGLARLMVRLAAPVAGTVLDPACGPGNILRAAGHAGADHLAGQEIDPVMARLARARLAPHGTPDIAVGDALRADAFTGPPADAVVCDPPFGYRDWGQDELRTDPRWEYGSPAKGEPELAWVQHCLAHAKPGGAVVLALPAGVASRRSGRAIRQALLRRGAVRAVIALPAGVLMSTGVPIHLWVLRKPGAGGAGPVLLVNTGHHQPARRGQVDWTALDEEVLGTWHEFGATGAVDTVAGRRRTLEPIDLLDEDVDLTPARHLPPPRPALDPEALERTRLRLSRLLGELDDLLPEFTTPPPGARVSTTIDDLARAGALTLRRQVGPLPTSETGPGPLVLTGRDVSTGSVPDTHFVGTEDDDPIHLRPGDLVVPLLAAGDGRPVTKVMDGGDVVLGPNLQLIRVNPDQVDVHFLAGQIRASSGQAASSTTASGVHRVDVRRVEVPVLDLGRQRRLGVAFERLEALDSTLGRAAALGVGLVSQLTEGLACGTVAPPE